MVKLWNLKGQPRGGLRQGQKMNNTWGYSLSESWENMEYRLFKEIRGSLEDAEEDYLFKKRVDMIPFTEG